MTKFAPDPEAGPKWCDNCNRRASHHHADGRCWTSTEFAAWFKETTGFELETG